MVSKNERFTEVEDCLKELTSLLPAEGEVSVDRFSSANKERFYTLVSRYASFKQDPALKGVVENLETKYNVSGGFRSQVEDYINRRKELSEKEKKEEIADREQQIIEDREDKTLQEIAQERKLTLAELKKLAASLGVKLEELAKKYGSMEKAEAELIEMAKKADLTAIYVAEVVAPQDQERFYARLPKDQQAKVRRDVAEHKKRMKNGVPCVFVPPVRPGMGYTVNRDATLPSGELIRDVYGENWHEPYVAAANKRGEYNDVRADYEQATQILCSHTMGYSHSEKQAVLTEAYAGGKVTVGRMRDLGISEETSNLLINAVNSARDGNDPKLQKNQTGKSSQKKDSSKPKVDNAHLNTKTVGLGSGRSSEPLEVISLKNAEADSKKIQANVTLAQAAHGKTQPDVSKTVALHAEENITKPDSVAVVDNQLQQDDLMKGRA